MKKLSKSFCLVCIANYCRSPVFEAFLNDQYGNNYEFYSAGIAPMIESTMDHRSLKFLKKNGLNPGIHTPKKLNKKMLNYFDYFLAVDHFVLTEMNRNFPKYKKKFKLVTSQFKDINIIDPYKFNDDEYESIMSKIFFVCKNIDLDII